MSRRFLTPVNLPSGATLPLAGSIGDLFFRTTDQSLYVYTSSGWTTQTGGGGGGSSTISGLTDVQLNNLSDGQVLLYSAASNKWVNLSLADILVELGAISTDGGNYNTEQFAATIDGGSPNTTVFVSAFDGGNESSF